MKTTHVLRRSGFFVVLGMGMSLGCTVEESGGGAGGNACSGATNSSASSSHSTGYSAPFPPPSVGTGDAGLTYPDCPVGVALLRGWEQDGTKIEERSIEPVTSDIDIYSYYHISGPDNEFLFLSWTNRVPVNQVYKYTEAVPGELVQVTGGWGRGNPRFIRAVEPGSTATFFRDPVTGVANLIYFHLYLYPAAEYLGCMRK